MRSLLRALLLLALATPAASAQDDAATARPAAVPPLPLSSAVDPVQYRVGPGDQFTLWVWGPVSRVVTTAVGPEGSLLLGDLGFLDVSGLTLAAARERVLAHVGRQLRGVGVDVRLTRPRRFLLMLAGDVRSPGPLLVQGGSSVGEILPDSLLSPRSSRRNITLLRADGTRRLVDLARVRVLAERESDARVGDGDIVQVPTLSRVVGIWGGVLRPGPQELGERDSVRTLLALAGGLSPDAAADKAMLVRWRSATQRDSIELDLRPGSPDLARELHMNDQLHVFRIPRFQETPQVTIVGQVGRSGVFPIERGQTRLSELLAAAGGLAPDADSTALRLIRRSTATEEDPEFDRLVRLSRDQMTESEYESFRTRLAARTPAFRVDASRLRQADRARDPVLEDGDIIRAERLAHSVRVDGQVRLPGLIAHRPGARWTDYVEAAGGYSARAARTQVRLTRAADQKTLRAKDAGEIAPGDFVWVPERPDVSAWSYVRDALVIGAQVATLIIAIRK